MKNSLTACLILCFSVSFAQLSVQNDAFLFVNDQVLFVTDDVSSVNYFYHNLRNQIYIYKHKDIWLLSKKKIFYEANRDDLIQGMKEYYYSKKRIKVSHEPKTIYFS